MKKYILFIQFMFLVQFIYAQAAMQNGEVAGKIVDARSHEPIEFATISVMSVSDSVVITGNVSEQNGKFIIKNIPVGEYYLQVNFMGYNEFLSAPFLISTVDNSMSIGTISLEADVEKMSAIVVKGEKKMIETRLDKRVYNASADISTQSGTALEMMRNVPSVQVDTDGNISLRGKQNVKILIDGRPSSFSASDLLRQTPASRVEKVEIITNPGAKYDPEGTAGIINIVLKKNDKLGFNGNINVGVQQATYTSYNTGIGLNVRNKHLNIYLNYGYSHRKRKSNGISERFIETASSPYGRISQDEYGYRTGGGHQIKTGMDIYINDWNTFYWSASYRKSDDPGARTVEYRYYDMRDSLLKAEQRYSTERDDDDNYRLNIGWIKKFANPEHQLDIDIMYDAGSENEYEEYFDRDYLPDGSLTDILNKEKQDEMELEGQLVARADYTQPFGETMKLGAGLRYDMRMENTNSRYYIFNRSEGYTYDPSRSNLFKYDENVIAGYVSWSQEIGNFSYKVGLRHETTFLSSDLASDTSVFKQEYSRLYPSVHLMQKVGETNVYLLSYSRRIDRPSPWQLNPFTDYNDPLSLRSGNPYLQPEDIHSIEAGYKKIWSFLTLNLTAYYRYIGNQINRYTEIENGITHSTFQNFGTAEEYGLETILSIRPAEWWDITTTLNTYQATLSNFGALEVANTKTFRFRAQWNSQFSLPREYTIQVTGHYTAPFKSAQTEISAFRTINLAFAKSFLDKKLRVSVSARDIFGWMRFKGNMQINSQISELMTWHWDSRRVGLSISYSFGKQSQKNARPYRDGGSYGGGMEGGRGF